MHSIIFMLAGLLFIAGSYCGRKARASFLASCIPTGGVVVAIKEEQQGSGDSVNQVQLPVVEYELDTRLRFKGEIDVRQHNLQVGDPVEVLVSRDNPRIARLQQGKKEMQLLLNALMALGVFGFGLGAYLFDPSDYSVRFLKDPFTLACAGLGIAFVAFKGVPMARQFLAHGPVYTENATEGTEEGP
ncbi:MAG: DUF3592 domain-containing protein [Marinobacter sp.]|uniref:DUF3592 domain-containing protein n=1 Tax=Marinobacter sp. TaxID=50741 RepID=UPI00299DFB26|nr:DUF3592 domain-containing protein [Marinobacter sp.]MDX1757398.1 DUF3592 domain-containing protein [Marinobacter sp.]